jgi:hypothetical protein
MFFVGVISLRLQQAKLYIQARVVTERVISLSLRQAKLYVQARVVTERTSN